MLKNREKYIEFENKLDFWNIFFVLFLFINGPYFKKNMPRTKALGFKSIYNTDYQSQPGRLGTCPTLG